MEGLYWQDLPDGSHQSYCRNFWVRGSGFSIPHKNRATALIRDYGIRSGDSVLVLGCGLGLLNEYLMAQGIVRVVGLDNGPFLDDLDLDREIAPEVRPHFLQVDLFDTRTARYDWVVTEDVAPTFRGQQLTKFWAASEAHLKRARPSTNVIHIITPRRGKPLDSSVVSMTENEWRGQHPAHSFAFTPLE